jgi:hypothetical protein
VLCGVCRAVPCCPALRLFRSNLAHARFWEARSAIQRMGSMWAEAASLAVALDASAKQRPDYDECERDVSAFAWPVSAEIYPCHACSCQKTTEGGNGAPGKADFTHLLSMLHALAVMSLRTDIELSNIVDHEPFQVFAGALSAEGLASSGAAATNSSSSSTGGGGGGGESPGGSSGRDAAALPTDPTAGINLHLTGDHGSEEDEEDATAHTGASTPSKTIRGSPRNFAHRGSGTTLAVQMPDAGPLPPSLPSQQQAALQSAAAAGSEGLGGHHHHHRTRPNRFDMAGRGVLCVVPLRLN